VEFYERQNSKYFSKIDAPAIVLAANTILSKSNQEAFLAFLLAIGAGLRRSEIDTLCWHQIDIKRGLIRVENTEAARLKTDESRAEVAIDEKLASTLQGYRALKKAKDGDFVITGDGDEGKKGWGQHYRANTVFDALITWLRDYKQDGKTPLKEIRKPIHELRKELGALITSKHGIYAASHTLRHSTVATTAAYYADKKERTTVGIGDWLTIDENVVPMPSTKSDEPIPKTFKKKSKP
jgi:integrase